MCDGRGNVCLPPTLFPLNLLHAQHTLDMGFIGRMYMGVILTVSSKPVRMCVMGKGSVTCILYS